MTIEEAWIKECRIIPNIVKSTGGVCLPNSTSLTVMPSRCSADMCMHWRWHTERVDKTDPQRFDMQLSTTNGYCGLAGRDGAE